MKVGPFCSPPSDDEQEVKSRSAVARSAPHIGRGKGKRDGEVDSTRRESIGSINAEFRRRSFQRSLGNQLIPLFFFFFIRGNIRKSTLLRVRQNGKTAAWGLFLLSRETDRQTTSLLRLDYNRESRMILRGRRNVKLTVSAETMPMRIHVFSLVHRGRSLLTSLAGCDWTFSKISTSRE